MTSSTALQNDDDFAFTVAASASYVLDAYLMINGAPTGTGDFKLDFTVPTSATMKYTSFGVTTSSAIQYEDTVNANSTARPVGTNGATDMGVALRAFVITSSTAGTVQMRWAQNTSSGTATIVRANSWMRLTRIA